MGLLFVLCDNLHLRPFRNQALRACYRIGDMEVLGYSKKLLSCRVLTLRTEHSGSKWQKTAEKKFTQSNFMSFSMQVSANLHNFRFRLPALHIQNLSNLCKHKYDPSISRVFFCNLVFGGFFVIWPNCET